MTTPCEKLHERADMLHHEADLSLTQAEVRGPGWTGFCDQIDIALRCEQLALQVEAKIEQDC